MARRRKKTFESTKRPVPAYMATFADMMTLMLTFFILLVAFAQQQRAELIAAGTGSFIQAIDTLGLPGLLPGGRRPISRGAPSPNFTIPNPLVEPAPDSVPLRQELLTAPNSRLERTTVDNLRQKRPGGFATAVAFRPGTAEMTPESGKPLDQIAELAQSALACVAIEAHVSGPGDGWALSGLRAAAVARYLHERGGVPYARISLAGCGRFRPISSAAGTPAANDRIQILLSPGPPE